MSGVIHERTEVEKLRYAMLDLTRRALADDPYLRAYVLALGGTLGFTALVDVELSGAHQEGER